ncbi:putative lipid II flippase FtsW [Guyparkeria hydrothermalis]|uniref:putative lipid II flippase FtsW n=1 Tax=Guyparkeria TaxID=2035712 RepID=UPI0010AC8866|nr:MULTISPECIES: putative lipid II flippase FtsW [Guyparkeria]MCL7750464.1 putative lipid II flippase FtsW [Guyparkeria hydrothermalis]TKA90576.1 putative lipid II flippase FtsW [Guyparkeria sp. SB14A]
MSLWQLNSRGWQWVGRAGQQGLQWLADRRPIDAAADVTSGVSVDRSFLIALLALLSIGLVMVASATLGMGDSGAAGRGLLIRQSGAVGVGLVAMVVLMMMPLRHFVALRNLILLASLLLLAVLFIPGVAHTVNGATRWIDLGFVRLQASEFARLGMIVWMAAYLGVHLDKVQTRIRGMGAPVAVIMLASTLLLLQPDYGNTVVLGATLFAMAWLMRAQLQTMLMLIAAGGALAIVGVFSAQYRVDRLLSFSNPFADPFGDGYQLVNALIAIGTGGLFGRGLGESVQKLAYLPEAHTDFIFAVYAEEFGLFGVIALLGLYGVLVWRGFVIARMAWAVKHYTGAALAWGISTWVGMQTLINMGVNMGLLPTKGLTLPLISYGGSAMVATLLAMGLILRVHHEASRAMAEAGIEDVREVTR